MKATSSCPRAKRSKHTTKKTVSYHRHHEVCDFKQRNGAQSKQETQILVTLNTKKKEE